MSSTAIAPSTTLRSPILSPNSEARISEENVITTIHQTVPEGLEIRDCAYGKGVFATKFFAAGSTLYEGEQCVIENEDALFTLVLDGKESYTLDTDTQYVNKFYFPLSDLCSFALVAKQTRHCWLLTRHAFAGC